MNVQSSEMVGISHWTPTIASAGRSHGTGETTLTSPGMPATARHALSIFCFSKKDRFESQSVGNEGISCSGRVRYIATQTWLWAALPLTNLSPASKWQPNPTNWFAKAIEHPLLQAHEGCWGRDASHRGTPCIAGVHQHCTNVFLGLIEQMSHLYNFSCGFGCVPWD